MESNELMHYGILGMKWGVRRTPEQLARARGQTKSESELGSKKPNTTAKKISSKSKKSISEMSDDELNKAVRRLQLEQQYRQLNPETVSTGQKFVNKVTKDVIVPAATTVARNTVQKVLEKEVKRLLNLDVKDNDKKKD